MRAVRIVDTKVVTAPPHEWTARYVTYATAHGETPASMLERDRARYPGGHMAGYIVWHSEQLRAFTAAHPVPAHRSYYIGHALTSEGHAAFDAWLETECQAEVADGR